MKLISSTLAGPGTEIIIGDALRSVAPLVDVCLVVWTGPDALLLGDADRRLPVGWADSEGAEAAAIEAAMDPLLRIAGERPYLFWRAWRWRDDFAAARNHALERAATAPGIPDWMVMLDTDERVVCHDPMAVRAFLSALPPEVEVLVAHAADGSHSRERFFRLPAKHRWIGRTHEAFPVEPGQQATIPAHLIAWTELPKTAEQLRAKNERDVVLLEAEVAEHPDDPRWRFYLGAALAGCGRLDEAIDAYRAAADRGRGEDCALACVRAAEILINEKRYEEAVAACARGMTIRPDIAELPWLAAGACVNAGDHHAAEAWARIAEVHGERGAGKDALGRRVSFRNPRALREGPGEILALAQRALGKVRPIHITVTSTAISAAPWAERCTSSVASQSYRDHAHIYFAGDATTRASAIGGMGGYTSLPAAAAPFPSLLDNLLPIWRSLPDDEVIVWLDGDDWLAHDRALEIVADAHARGALATYGSFMTEDGHAVNLGACGPDPRSEPWRASHLKSFRAGLAKKIRDEDLRRPDGAYVDLAIDQAVMLPIVEMAAEHAVHIPRILCVYNRAHSFEANASEALMVRERAEVSRIRALPRYERIA